jgi:mannose-6-phosphate isomerase
MSALYPFLMVPIFDERPWGVRDLRPIYTRAVTDPIGESWLTWEDNRVANGPLAGRPLADLAKEYRCELVGTLAIYEDRFPLLVKFLFPGDKLSVQVHPDDEGAKKHGQPCGKTECWYVLRAEPGAQVALGLKPGTTLDEFRRAITETRAEALLNWVDVFAGDMIYVAAGTVHTIGGGMVLVETQQTSDITYRLYDYGRPRELHVEDGLAATKLHTNAGKVGRASLQARVSADKNLAEPASAGASILVRSPFFQVEKIPLREPMHTEVSPNSPHILVAVGGAGVVESHGMEPITFATGDAVVIPACVGAYTVRPQWELELMRMSLPSGTVPEPETTLPRSTTAP